MSSLPLSRQVKLAGIEARIEGQLLAWLVGRPNTWN